MGHLHQSLRLAVYSAHSVCHARIANPAFVEDANIDADNVSLVQNLRGTGDTVTNHIVDRDANSGRESGNSRLPIFSRSSAIAFIDRFRTLAADIVLSNAVKFSGGSVWHNIWAQHFIGLGDNPPRLAQLRNLLP